MVTRSDSLWKTLDWVTIAIYLLLIIAGWFSVCGASYDYGERDFLDFSGGSGFLGDGDGRHFLSPLL